MMSDLFNANLLMVVVAATPYGLRSAIGFYGQKTKIPAQPFDNR